VCEKCGLPLERPGLCSRCRAMLPQFSRLRSWSVFESPLKEALHRLKYRRDLGLGEAIADQMSDFVEKLDWKIELLIPIPLGKQRLKQRGYNQVAMIALPLALRLGLAYHPGSLIRCRDTKSQVGLSASQRRENMDDVSTTGATLSSAAGALYQAGAQTVNAVTVARALPIHGLVHV
jgi:competence protein ComFC